MGTEDLVAENKSHRHVGFLGQKGKTKEEMLTAGCCCCGRLVKIKLEGLEGIESSMALLLRAGPSYSVEGLLCPHFETWRYLLLLLSKSE